jgi:UDP:flavonoid glycosyltransferase YjiC (YdhE family)
MRITLVAMGTRGDVQPVLALGKGLQAAGQSVRVVAGANFESWVRSYGFDFVPSVDMEAIMQSEDGIRWAQSSDSPRTQLAMMKRLLEQHEQAMVSPLLSLPVDADLLVSGFTSEPFVQTLSDASGVPYINAFLQPYAPTRSGAASLNALLPRRSSLLNLIISTLAPRIVWSISAGPANRLREKLSLPTHSAGSYIRATRHTPTLYGFSPQVVPSPSDWGPEKVVTGYWFLEERRDWQPPTELTAFLESGPPPVYVGFGSMSAGDPQATARLIADAVALAGQRAVVGSGWSRLSGFAAPANVYVVDHVPHDWLFERVAAVVHHGGAGTTGAGLRAGRPTMIVPHMADQPFWGRRVQDLGVGVPPIPRHKLTSSGLADGITRLTGDAALQRNAAALGARIRAEEGVARAVENLLQWAGSKHA